MFYFTFYNFNNFQNHLVDSTNTILWYCNTCFHNTIHVSAGYKPTTFLLGCSKAHTNNTTYHYLTWTYILPQYLLCITSEIMHVLNAMESWHGGQTLRTASHYWLEGYTLERACLGTTPASSPFPAASRQHSGIKNQTPYDCSVRQRSEGMAIWQASYLRYVRMSTGKGQVLGDHITASWVWVSVYSSKPQ